MTTSIAMATYNGKKYIEEALDSFLMQKTNFPFEIVVDDDCSPDNTANIIKKYIEKFPNIINANLREKNVGAMNNFMGNMKRAKGKYIAICEGDDYWTDPLKLQKQVNIFTKYSDVTICFHSGKEIDMLNNKVTTICNHFNTNTKVPVENVFIGRGGYMPTASLMFKNIQIELMINSFKNAPIGDFFIQAYMASLGSIYYINEPMCVYRRNASGSWTDSQKNLEIKKLYNYSMIMALDNFSKFLAEKEYKQLIYNVMIHYTISYISLLDGFVEKFLSINKISINLKNYNKLMFLLKNESRVLKYEIKEKL